MINKMASNKYRARYDYGYAAYVKRLKLEAKQLEQEKRKLLAIKKRTKTQDKTISKIEGKIAEKAATIQITLKGITTKDESGTRRSFTTSHLWQAKEAEELFKEAYELESNGQKLPRPLVKAMERLKEAPQRTEHLAGLAFQFASIASFKPAIIKNLAFDNFIDQADVNLDWIKKFQITESEIKKTSMAYCEADKTIKLKGKKFLFTGSFVGFTACEDYIYGLIEMAKHHKVDGLITVGPWIKYIFMHKTSGDKKVLDAVKKLIKTVKVYAIKSNRESPEMLLALKELGVNFVNRIEDDRNLFIGLQFSKSSAKNQLGKYLDHDSNKNLYVHTTYVALESQLRNDKKRYILGSGSGSFNTPTSRIWSMAYDSQLIGSSKYDVIGGHLLSFDNEGEVYPTQFFYSKETKGVFSGGKVFKRNTKTQAEINLIISDVHALTVNREGLAALLDYIDKNKNNIKTLSINGDFFNNEVLCHHNHGDFRTQFEVKKTHRSFLHEVAVTQSILKEILSRLKKGTKKIFKMGNHEVNSISSFLKRDINHFLDTMLDLPVLLNLEGLGFKIIEGRDSYTIAGIPVWHGHEFRGPENGSRNLGKNNLKGHSHTPSISNTGTSMPALEDEKRQHYTSFKRTSWRGGWAIITSQNGISTRPELIFTENLKYADGKVITLKKEYKPSKPKKIDLSFDLDWTAAA